MRFGFRTHFGMFGALAWLSIGTGCSSTDASPATAMDADAGPGTGDDAAPSDGSSREFEITIANVSGDATLTTPVSPGVYATHGAGFSLFTDGQADRGEGLARIAEDGNPATLAAALEARAELLSKGVFDTPDGADAKGPARPGDTFTFRVRASAASPNVSFATMYGQSNDWFFAPGPEGIPLFGSDGQALPERDVSDLVHVWDVGSEVNQAPGMGPDQGPRQKAPDTGPAEGVLARFTDTTRAYPSARSIARVSVAFSSSDESFIVLVKNVSGPPSSIVTGISPVYYAVHDASWTLFDEGSPAKPGLEGLAEDGDAQAFVYARQGDSGVTTFGAALVPDGASKAGGAPPGGSFTFRVKPDAGHRFLSIASMVGESNDAFLAFGPHGVALLDDAGAPRSNDAIAADVERMLVVWDAGTEANEVPGAGANQGPRQAAPNTGAPDPDPTVRRYADATNDLATGAGGVLDIGFEQGPDAGHLVVTVTNVSGATPFPGRASPAIWITHTGHHTFFKEGQPSPEGVEHLAEDGNPTAWDAALVGIEDVSAHGIVNMPDGTSSTGPISVGAKYKFSIPVGGNAQYFDFAAMWTPSNDTFVSLGEKGVALVDAQGKPRAPKDITADAKALLSAWDAGTEANQAGALGPDQAPRQSGQNTGAGEGGGLVRRVDSTWGVPDGKDFLRVTVKPL